MVNHEADRFSVWEANTAPTDSEIVAIDKANNEVSELCATSTGPSPLSSSSTAPSAQSENTKLSGGAIGGIVVGAVTVLSILGAIGFLLLRRRRAGNAPPHALLEADKHTVDVKPPTYSIYDVVHEEPQELPGYRNHVIELDGRAVDSNRI